MSSFSLSYRASRWLWFAAQTRLRPKLGETFTLDGRAYPYFFHESGMTWRTERAVELPLALEAVKTAGDLEILEVGNVLRQYTSVSHTIVDKYEIDPDIVNEDVLSFRGGPYDLIVSVSTLEHIGWDEDPIEPDKARRTIERLKELLRPGGRLFLTFPYNWNHYLDQDLVGGRLGLDEVRYLKRIDFWNHWQQVDKPDHPGLRYGYPYPGASMLVVATVTRQAEL